MDAARLLEEVVRVEVMHGRVDKTFWSCSPLQALRELEDAEAELAECEDPSTGQQGDNGAAMKRACADSMLNEVLRYTIQGNAHPGLDQPGSETDLQHFDLWVQILTHRFKGVIFPGRRSTLGTNDFDGGGEPPAGPLPLKCQFSLLNWLREAFKDPARAGMFGPIAQGRQANQSIVLTMHVIAAGTQSCSCNRTNGQA